MPILAHAEKNQIKPRRDQRQLFRSQLRARSRRQLAPNAVDFLRRDAERLEQKLVCHPEIALRIRRRHTPLIRPEKMHVREGRHVAVPEIGVAGTATLPQQRHHRREEFLRDAPAGQRHAMRPPRARRRRDLLQPRRRNRTG